MGNSLYRQNAGRYRLLAEKAHSATYRSMLLTIANEWEAMANAAEKGPKRPVDQPALNQIATDQPYLAIA